MTLENTERFVVNSNSGDGLNGKVFESWTEAREAIKNVYGQDELDLLDGHTEGESQTEIVPL